MERNGYYKFKLKKAFTGLFIFLAIFGFGGIVMLLWNAILPDIMPVSKITYWQAMGILILSKILFGGFRFGPPRHGKPPFANRGFREKFMNMSAEEREAFKAKWKERCIR